MVKTETAATGARARRRALALASCVLLASGCGSVTNKAPPDGPQGTGADAGVDAGVDAGGIVDAAPADFSIAAAMSQVDLRVPKITSLAVTISRGAGFSDPVVVSATGLPAGVSANAITIPSGQTQGTLMVDASGGTGGDQATVTLVGTSGTLMHTANVSVFVVGAPGTPDVTFGSGGHAALPSSVSDAQIRSLLAGPNGTFIAVGDQGGEIIAIRFSGNGMPDSSFGQSGIAHVNFSSVGIPSISFSAGTLQSNGDIILAGIGTDASNNNELVLARLSPDGVTDTTFAGGGKEANSLSGLGGVAVDAMDRILVTAGQGFNGGPGGMARFTPDGVLDTSFNSTGYESSQAISFLPPSVDDSDRIVIHSGQNHEFLRFLDDGALDPNFATTGMSAGPFFALPGGAIRVAIQGSIYGLRNDGSSDTSFGTNGSLAVSATPGAFVLTPAGRGIEAGEDSSNHVLLARVGDLATGTLDSSFGTDGILVDTNTTGRPDALALRTDNRLVIAVDSDPSGAPGTYSFAQYWY